MIAKWEIAFLSKHLVILCLWQSAGGDMEFTYASQRELMILTADTIARIE
jgi:hypothetical protein